MVRRTTYVDDIEEASLHLLNILHFRELEAAPNGKCVDRSISKTIMLSVKGIFLWNYSASRRTHVVNRSFCSS